MWKRDEPVPNQPHNPTQPASTSLPAADQRALSPRPTGGTAILGPSLACEGKLSGDEDLVVEGRFRGEILVPSHQVTIGGNGQVEGEVRASAIVVEGEVRGNLTASQQVLVRASGKVLGDIRAPRVALDQGCRFKGAIDMEPNGKSAGNDTARAADRKEARPAVAAS